MSPVMADQAQIWPISLTTAQAELALGDNEVYLISSCMSQMQLILALTTTRLVRNSPKQFGVLEILCAAPVGDDLGCTSAS